MNPLLLKRLLLLFWAVWLTVVFATNLLDGLKALGVLAESWAFASGNYQFIGATTARYGVPAWANLAMFAGVILWEAVAAGLFWRAAVSYRGRAMGRAAVYAAFTASLLLWGSFLLTDEVFIAYTAGGTHLRLFVAHLVTLLAVELLPEE